MIYAYRYFLVIVLTISWGVLGMLLGLLDRSGEGVVWVARNWMSWILKGCGIRIVAEGLENFDPSQPHVFMSNHQSAIDIAAIVLTLPCSFRFVAKKELAYIPFFGWSMALGGHILIDRSNRTQALRSLERAGHQIRDGTNVIVFPEGTRSAGHTLQPFKKGGFHLAIQSQVPVIPVTVSGSHQITPPHSLRIESGEVKIHYGKPIPTAGMTPVDRHALADAVHQAIQRGFDPAYQGDAG